CGSGTPTIGNPNSPATTFACGSAVSTDCTLTLTVGLNGTGADGGTVGQVCTGVANTTISETIHCESGMGVCGNCATGQTQCGTFATGCDCENLSNGSGMNGSCGTCGTGTPSTTACVSPNSCQSGICKPPPPVPCTGGTAPNNTPAGCVPCDGNTNGVCSPTEAIIVARDITNNNLTASNSEAGSNGCYECLWNAGCLDDTVNLDANKECGDLAGTVGAGAQSAETKTAACLNALNCIFPSDCQNAKATSGASASDGISNCFCGSDYPNTTACSAATSPAPNGSCYQTELDGLGDTSATAIATVLGAFTTRTTGAGMANAIFQCAGSNNAVFLCPTCF
ncbi:MAG: hypothetical protein ACRENE_24140, partial [Polyangiaceae bacterium]